MEWTLCRYGSGDRPAAPRGRLTYRTLQRQFQLDEVVLEDLKEELNYGQRLRVPWNSWPAVTQKRPTRASIRSWNT